MPTWSLKGCYIPITEVEMRLMLKNNIVILNATAYNQAYPRKFLQRCSPSTLSYSEDKNCVNLMTEKCRFESTK